MASRTTDPLKLDHNSPEIDFGLEIEFSFVLQRSKYNEFDPKDEPVREEWYRREFERQNAAASKDAPNTPTSPLHPRKKRSVQSPSHGALALPLHSTQEGQVQSEGTSSQCSSRSSPDPITPPHQAPRYAETQYSSETIATACETLQNNIRRYIIQLLNHELPDSPSTVSLLGPVRYQDEPKTGVPDHWKLTYDATVDPHRIDYATQFDMSPLEARWKVWVGGAELVSPILRVEEAERWVTMLKQIDKDLKYDGIRGAFFTGMERLHVHMSMRGQEMDISTARNVMALYGLFEDEIGGWIGRASSEWCQSLRLKPGSEDNNHREDKLSPREFTDRIYKARTYLELQNAVSAGGENTSQVYISPPREGKVRTIEFRHLEGTLGPTLIKWWVLFLEKLLSYSRLLATADIRILDEGPIDEESGFVEILPHTKSILDLIEFPEKGKVFLRKRADLLDEQKGKKKRNWDDMFAPEPADAMWGLEDLLLQNLER